METCNRGPNLKVDQCMKKQCSCLRCLTLKVGGGMAGIAFRLVYIWGCCGSLRGAEEDECTDSLAHTLKLVPRLKWETFFIHHVDAPLRCPLTLNWYGGFYASVCVSVYVPNWAQGGQLLMVTPWCGRYNTASCSPITHIQTKYSYIYLLIIWGIYLWNKEQTMKKGYITA